MERDVDEDRASVASTASSSDAGYAWDDQPLQVVHVPDNPYIEDPDGFCLAEVHCNAAEYEAGRDLQGIDWDVLPHSRQQLREAKAAQQANFLDDPLVMLRARKDAQPVEKDALLYRFHSFRQNPHHDILHFQLRNLLCATSAFEFYYFSRHSIKRYNSLNGRTREVLNLHSSSRVETGGLGAMSVSTFTIKDGLMAVGGITGELLVKQINGDVYFAEQIANAASGITNGIEFYSSQSGSRKLATASNDSMVRIFAVEGFRGESKFATPWAPNWVATHPHGAKMMAVVGDDPVGLLLDSSSGQHIAELEGHQDYSFAAAWHPDGVYIATGNQDTTALVWDIRMTDSPVYTVTGQRKFSPHRTLLGDLGAVRSIRYSPDGRTLAVGEASDYVNLFDVTSGYSRAQQIEVYAEISGLTFTPEGTSFMVSLMGDRHGGFLQYQQSLQGGHKESEGRRADGSSPLTTFLRAQTQAHQLQERANEEEEEEDEDEVDWAEDVEEGDV